AGFKKIVRDQFFTLLLDERRAVEAIPSMLVKDPELSARMAPVLGRLMEVVGVESAAGKMRLREIEKLFGEKPRSPKGKDLEAERAAQNARRKPSGDVN